MSFYVYLFTRPFAHRCEENVFFFFFLLSNAYLFSYLAIMTLIAFSQCTLLYMLNHCELPAFQAGLLTLQFPRALAYATGTNALPGFGVQQVNIQINAANRTNYLFHQSQLVQNKNIYLCSSTQSNRQHPHQFWCTDDASAAASAAKYPPGCPGRQLAAPRG